MSWRAQNRSKDAKTPSVGLAMSQKPELDLWPVQPYCILAIYWLLAIAYCLLSIGYWLLSIGYCLLAIGCCQLAIVYWLLYIGYWLLAVVYCLLSIGYWLLAMYCLAPLAKRLKFSSGLALVFTVRRNSLRVVVKIKTPEVPIFSVGCERNWPTGAPSIPVNPFAHWYL